MEEGGRVQAAFKVVIWMVFLCWDRLNNLCYTQDTSSIIPLPSYIIHHTSVFVEAFAAIAAFGRGLGEGHGGDG